MQVKEFISTIFSKAVSLGYSREEMAFLKAFLKAVTSRKKKIDTVKNYFRKLEPEEFLFVEFSSPRKTKELINILKNSRVPDSITLSFSETSGCPTIEFYLADKTLFFTSFERKDNKIKLVLTRPWKRSKITPSLVKISKLPPEPTSNDLFHLALELIERGVKAAFAYKKGGRVFADEEIYQLIKNPSPPLTDEEPESFIYLPENLAKEVEILEILGEI